MNLSVKKNLLEYPERIKNLCIMAHVDHGKTTLADALVASNGIITLRQAGKIRYMDSRQDEVERGITMKSSCVTLTYKYNEEIYVINLIDSPGHVDFSSEVSTAVRLCDGTIIVVDVVEGVCAQTKVVLRQAWLENIRPVLVLNKIDRLILEMKLTPLDAYYHMNNVLEQVNAFMGELYNTEVLERLAEEEEERKKKTAKERRDRKSSEGRRISEGTPLGSSYVFESWTIGDDIDDSELYFSPEKGNVLFASAYDGWGFRLGMFAEKYHKKYDLGKEDLNNGLWGDFYISSKGGKKKVVSGAREKGKPPLFVSLILENLYKIYEVIINKKDNLETEKIATSLGIKLSSAIVKSTDQRQKLNYILSSWLPLASAVLEMVVNHLPSACHVSEERACKLMCTATQGFDSLPPQTQILKKAFVDCSSNDDSPLIVYVSKMFGVEKSCISQTNVLKEKSENGVRGMLSMEEIKERRKQAQLTKNLDQENGDEKVTIIAEEKVTNITEEKDSVEENEEELIAFARVFSGTLRVGQKVYVLGPKHNPNDVVALVKDENLSEEITLPHMHLSEVKDIYLLLGRQLERVKSAPAGSIIGIGGLQGILKSATISSTKFCPPFTELSLQVTPILRVAVEPADPRDLTKLRKGLKILNQADPCVQIEFQENGEYVIVTAGEVHLQKCIEDLEKRYARVSLTVSQPIVPFRETVIPHPTVDRLNEAILGENVYVGKCEEEILKDGVYKISNNIMKLKVRAVSLPSKVTELLEKNSHLLQMIRKSYCNNSSEVSINNETNLNNIKTSSALSIEGLSILSSFKKELNKLLEESGDMWKDSFNQIWSFGPHYCGGNILINRVKDYNRPSVWDSNISSEFSHPLYAYDSNIVMGFQLATAMGPLCEEPMMGVGFIVEKLVIYEDEEGTNSSMGQMIPMAKEAMRKAFSNNHQRLICPMYSCAVNVTSEVVGRLYDVIGKRHGRIIDGDITEGSTSWNVTAYLPIVESFNFASDLRKSTSGEAMPQLLFSHWEILDIDPFWEPETSEELTHWGDKADAENLARLYINNVRKRKGLSTDEKIVQFAEKQRNLSKNK